MAVSPYINRFVQPDSIIPSAENPQTWNRYTYVGNNPTNHNDPDGRCYPICTAVIGAAIGAIAGAVAYTVGNHGQSFDTTEMLVAAGVGAVAGGLIGTGVGLVAGATTAAASAAVASTSASLISAGTSMTVTGGSYIAQTSGGSFETKPFAANTAVAGATAYLSYGAGPASKLAYDFIGAEIIYHTTSRERSLNGYVAAGLGGLAGGLVDIQVGRISNMLLEDFSYSPTSFMGTNNAPFTGSTALELGVKQRSYAAGRTILSGLSSSAGFNLSAIYVQNRVQRELDKEVKIAQ